jgi:DNA helicase-2/ATP-dependent DNA helicase PcrA
VQTGFRDFLISNCAQSIFARLEGKLPSDSPAFFDKHVLGAVTPYRQERIGLRGQKSLSQLDLPTLIDVALSPVNFSLVSDGLADAKGLKRLLIELRQVRNRWAHESDLLPEDRIRDSDTVVRVLTAIESSDEQIAVAKGFYRDALAGYVDSTNKASEAFDAIATDSIETSDSSLWVYTDDEPVAASVCKEIQFDNDQRRVIEFPERNLVVRAGPGTGKTAVLCARAERMIEKYGSGQVLVLTFSRRSALEIRERLRTSPALRGINWKKAWVGTFHSLCYRVLNAFGTHVGLAAGWGVLESADAEALFDPWRGSQYSLYCRVRNALMTADDIINEFKERFDPELDEIGHNEAVESAKGFLEKAAEYRSLCVRDNVIDYDDLQVLTLKLLQSVPEVKEKLAAKFRAILVDEYQDTSPIQTAILRELQGEVCSITAIGDGAQAIYAFRGSTVGAIQHFARDFLASELELSVDYRATQSIVDATNSIIKATPARNRSSLKANKLGGPVPRILRFHNDVEEAVGIADELEQLVRCSKKPTTIAVVARTRRDLAPFKAALDRRSIRTLMIGEYGFTDLPYVECFFGLARLLVNPEDASAIARVVRSFDQVAGVNPFSSWPRARNASRTRLAELWAQFVEITNGQGESADQKLGFEAQLPHEADSKYFRELFSIDNPGSVDAFRHVSQVLLSLVRHFFGREVGMTVRPFPDGEDNELLLALEARFIPEQRRAAGNSSRIDALPAEPKPRTVDFHRLERLVAVCSSIDELFLLPDTFDTSSGSPDGICVDLTTIHSAKGLQWDHVYLVRSLEESYRQEGVGVDRILEEERVFYVGATRARSTLTISFADAFETIRSGARHWKRQTPFALLGAIPPNVIRSLRVNKR